MREFGELEAVVMDRVWSADTPMTVRTVLEDLRPQRPLAYTTVMTVMDNLYRKGWLRRDREGLAYRYVAVMSRDAYAADVMTRALSDSRDRGAALMQFVAQMSPEETADLRAALRSVRRGRS